MALRKPTHSAKPGRKGRADLTEEQKQEIKEAFDLFDTDGSGKINHLSHFSITKKKSISF